VQSHQLITPFPVDLDPFDGFSGRQLVDRRDGEHRLALVHRLVAECLLAFGIRGDALAKVGHDVGGRGQLVGREDAFDARQRERFGRVDAYHARVRIRREEQLAEQHPVRAEILRVLRLPRHLRDEIRRHVVFADQFVGSHIRRSSCAQRRASAR